MKQLRQQGFTLIEMLVVAPIVILAIGAFLTVIISMTGEVIASRASNVLSYNVQDALNRIEQDVKLSATFLASNNVKIDAGNAQGYNDDTTNFANVGSSGGPALILNMIATTGNPLSTTSGFVYLKDKPNACATAQGVNTPLTYNVVYFIKDDVLWRRTLMPSNYTDTNYRCADPWQQPSCSPTYMEAQTGPVFCKTNDVKLIEGVAASGFSLQYYSGAGNSTANGTANSTSASPEDRASALVSSTTLSVAINAKQNAGGREVERTASLRVSRLETNASGIAVLTSDTVPAAPTITATEKPGARATFTWPSVSGATGYTFEYNVNGGAWQTVFTNQNTRTATVGAPANEDIINARVTAINSAGSSSPATKSLQTPLWETFDLQNYWYNYQNTYSTAQYTKTKDGMVVVKGLLSRVGTPVANETIATLPEGYRPSGTLIFGTSIASNVTGRVDVYSDGRVAANVTSPSWTSLETIRFVPDGRYTRTALPLLAGWTNYASPYSPASYLIDNSGRYVLQGLIVPGTITNGTIISSTASGLVRPEGYQHHATRSSGFAHIGFERQPATGAGVLLAKGDGSGYVSVNSIYYPYTYTNWTNLSLVNGWVNYAAGTYSSAQFTKSSSDNMVYLKGLIGSGTATAGTVITTLPVGSRPKERILYTNASGGGYGRVDILSNGQVTIQAGVNSWFSLDGIIFKAEQ